MIKHTTGMIHKNFQIKADHIKKIMTIPILLAKQLKNFVFVCGFGAPLTDNSRHRLAPPVKKAYFPKDELHPFPNFQLTLKV